MDIKEFAREESKAVQLLKKAGFQIIGYDFKENKNALIKEEKGCQTVYYVDSWQQAVSLYL